MDVPKHVLDTPKNRCVVFVMFCLKFYRLPTTRCENDTIRHVFLSSFTVYRYLGPKILCASRHAKNATVFGVSRPIYILHFIFY